MWLCHCPEAEEVGHSVTFLTKPNFQAAESSGISEFISQEISILKSSLNFYNAYEYLKMLAPFQCSSRIECPVNPDQLLGYLGHKSGVG